MVSPSELILKFVWRIDIGNSISSAMVKVLSVGVSLPIVRKGIQERSGDCHMLQKF